MALRISGGPKSVNAYRMRSQVETRGPLDSRIAGIEDVEDPGRIVEGAGMCVEGVKED